MIDPNAGGFQSTATDEGSWFQDLTNYTRSQYALQGLVPPSIGVSKPDQPVTDAASYLDTLHGWFAQQRAVQGGAAGDAIDTPVSATYRERRYQFLSREEGIRGFAYDDKTGQQIAPGQQAQGYPTVGIGFNMGDSTSPARFAAALPGVDFDGVKDGRVKLNDAQVQKLFDFNIQESESQVAKATQGVDLPEHQRLALVSLAFNSPASLAPIAESLRNGDPGGALASLLSSPGGGSRRLREAAMFAGTVDAPQAIPAAMDGIAGSANFAKRSGVFGDPTSPGWAAKNLVEINAPGGATFQVHRLAADAFKGFLGDLEGQGYKVDPSQSSSYALSNIRGGSELSEHAFGNAIDINSLRNPMGQRLVTDLPANVSQLAAKWGLTWGGDWHSRKDAMHFEWAGTKTPALLALASR